MRAKINHGQRGTDIDRLVKEYDFDCPREYYGYIVQSYENGHPDQVIELFNRMKGELQKNFLLNIEFLQPVYGEKIHDLIIKSL